MSGTLVGVDADRDIALTYDGRDRRVAVRRLVHDVTPMAPDGGDREQDRHVTAECLLEGLGSPGLPHDALRRFYRHERVVRSLRERFLVLGPAKKRTQIEDGGERCDAEHHG